MKQINYNIQIIREFNMGDDVFIPFLFSLDKIKAFPDQAPKVDNNCSYNYKGDFLKDGFRDRVFEYAYIRGIPLEIDEFLDEFKEGEDYYIENESAYINSSHMFFEFITVYTGYSPNTMSKLKSFIANCEREIINAFYKAVIDDLELEKKDSYERNEYIHFFQWALGQTQGFSNPFFPENIGKATIDWSFREIELRNLYRSKEFTIENAIEKLKAKMFEDAKNKKK